MYRPEGCDKASNACIWRKKFKAEWGQQGPEAQVFPVFKDEKDT